MLLQERVVWSHSWTCIVTAMVAGAPLCHAQADDVVSFTRDIRPILSKNCYQCHGPDKQERQAELRLDKGSEAFADRGGYAAIVSKNPHQSELFRRITSQSVSLRMPPAKTGKGLTPSQVALIEKWIRQGANYQEHWAFLPPERPDFPQLEQLPSSPIDYFVWRQLDSRGISPSPRTDSHTLIRRVSFDLTGLPPTISEVHAFVDDRSSQAYERLVDRLLSSPHYGERMAQNWLDSARYADTTGFASDKPRTMWLFRDWVVDAFNRNMPFDQFTIEQLAGDMLPNATELQNIATGFHRNSMQALGNNPRKEEFRIKGIVDRLDTTGRVWLGLTLACAECHDHKYDPLSQRDYYSLFAIFNNVPHYGETFKIHGPRLDVQKHGRGVVTAQVMEEMSTPRETHIHIRGNFANKGEQVFPGVPKFLGPLPPDVMADRLSFAHWLVDGRNPLVARVVVNRLWQHFFGTGIVRTTEDFGAQGEWPSHPELLDWLAVEFIESGWDVRHINKLIVMSETYRQISKASGALLQDDFYNRWLARGPRQRLAAEQIRDNALAISGLLCRTVGGPSVYPLQPSQVGEFRDATAGAWETSTGRDRYRRSLYTFWQRMYPYPSLAIFDAPSRERCVVRRTRSNTPLQALVTLNDPAFFQAAQAFARLIVSRDGQQTTESRLTFAFESALARLPSAREQTMFMVFFKEQQREFSDNLKAAVTVTAGYAQPDLAAWTMVASTLLNLDETITKQ